MQVVNYEETRHAHKNLVGKISWIQYSGEATIDERLTEFWKLSLSTATGLKCLKTGSNANMLC